MKIRNVCTIFHHTDNDGYASAKVCLNKCREDGYSDDNIICVPITLNGKQIDTIINKVNSIPVEMVEAETITVIDHIYIVDISIPTPEEILRIGDAVNSCVTAHWCYAAVHWYDHHKTSADALEELSKGVIYGFINHDRPNFKGDIEICTDYSAAKVCWLKLFPNIEVPQVIELVSDHDIFAHRLEGSLEFFNGSGIYNLRDIKSTFWDGLIADGPVWGEHIDMVVSSGDVIGQYMTELLYPMIFAQRIEFKLSICSPHKEFTFDNCVAVNSIVGNSAIFGDCGEGYKSYDICVKYYQNKDGNYTYTLYSDKYDISHICKHLGGGGHPGAAGFTIGHNMFELPDSDERIHNLKLYSADGKLLEKYLPDTSIRECPLA